MHLARQDASFGNTESVKLSGVKRIDTTGFGVNKVTLSIRDVIDMTDYNNRLVVIGDKGDTVNLTGLGANNNWQAVGPTWHDESDAAVVEIGNHDDLYQLSEAFRRTGNLGLHVKSPRSATWESR